MPLARRLTTAEIAASLRPVASGVHVGAASTLIDGPAVTPGCVCGDRCEMPCWQRVGLVDVARCCCDRAAGPAQERKDGPNA